VVPIGSQNSAPNSHGSFRQQRYDHPHHQCVDSYRPSVFQRIEWPQNQNFLTNLDRRDSGLSWPKNRGVKSKKRVSNIQSSNHCDKGKEPMGPEIEFWACKQCAASGLPRTICSQKSICSKCHIMGHSGPHCKAQWHATCRKLDPHSSNRAVEASTSKNPQSKASENPIPSLAPDASPSPLATDLNLVQVPSTEHHHRSLPFTQQEHAQASSQQDSMANQIADSAPFAPFGFHAMDVQHRAIMYHAIVHHQNPMHEDYAIISIHPLLIHAMHFAAVHEVVLEFLEEHMNVKVRNIQPSHLGQALVRFENVHDRDSQVLNGPFSVW
jgi:hypothetical protein